MQCGWKYIHVAVVIDPLTGQLWWGVAAEHAGRGDGSPPGDLGAGTGYCRLGLGRARDYTGTDMQAEDARQPVPEAWQAALKRVRPLCG